MKGFVVVTASAVHECDVTTGDARDSTIRMSARIDNRREKVASVRSRETIVHPHLQPSKVSYQNRYSVQHIHPPLGCAYTDFL